jgi:transketolase N-terminal domain/subunit
VCIHERRSRAIDRKSLGSVGRAAQHLPCHSRTLSPAGVSVGAGSLGIKQSLTGLTIKEKTPTMLS